MSELWTPSSGDKEFIQDPVVDHGLCPNGRCKGRLKDDKCPECGWTVQSDLDSIKRYMDDTFPNGVDANATRAREEQAQLHKVAAAMRGEDAPFPTGTIKELGRWHLVARESGNGVYFDTQVMQMVGGCLVRTLTDGINHEGGPAHGSSMVFVPGAKLEHFHVQPTYATQREKTHK